MAPLHPALFAALAALAAAADVKLVPVMEAGATSTGCTQGGCKYAAFRIPGLVNAGNNTMIAFAEGRKFGCGDFGPPPPPGKHGWGQHDMVISRSTDGGHTFGPLTTVLDALSFPPWKNIDAEAKPDNGNAIWDPTPVWDKHTDTVWFFFNGPGREAADCLSGICSTWATTSTDKGLTVRSHLRPPHPTPAHLTHRLEHLPHAPHPATLPLKMRGGAGQWSEAKNMTTHCQRPGKIAGTFTKIGTAMPQ